MRQTFRQSMTWLHTWFGLVLGFVLMVCFFFGGLSVFDRELDRWAIPETRFDPQPMPRFDAILAPAMQRLKPRPEEVAITQARVAGTIPDPNTLPISFFYAYTTHRDPVVEIGGEFDIPNKPLDPADEHQHVHGYETIDPRNGNVIPDTQFKLGSGFFYPLHFSLTLEWREIGYWIVGLSSLAMLAALVSGVVIHRKIFRELFTFRPRKQAQRSVLDLHDLTGVVALPFHFFFAFTGLLIFASIYFPVSENVLRPLARQHEVQKAMHTGLAHDAAGVAAPLASVDAMVAEAKRRWAANDMPGEAGYLELHHIGDRNGYVSVYRGGADRVALLGHAVHFEASTGRVIREDPAPTAVASTTEFLTGLHLQQFEHWLLRWLYLFGGLAGCVCIATGFLFFVGKRHEQHARAGLAGSRVVDALAITTVTGMLLATVTILLANRLLPAELAQRDWWQKLAFWGAWALALIHAFVRSTPARGPRVSPAWREQCFALAVLAAAAPLANWLTTGDHLGRTLFRYWPVAGIDLFLFASAGIAWYAARRLAPRPLPAGEVVHV